MLRHVEKKAVAVRSAGVCVVLNTQFPEMENELRDLPVHICWNEEAHLGMSSSIRTGVKYLPETASGAAILLADPPCLTLLWWRG